MMTNPQITPCTINELYAVPVAGYHYKPSRAKVVPIVTSAVQPALAGAGTLPLATKRNGVGTKGTIMTVLAVLGVGMFAIGCYSYFKHLQAQDEEQ